MTEKRDVSDSPPPERDRRTEPGSDRDPPGSTAAAHETSRGPEPPDGEESNEGDEDPIVPEPMSAPVLAGQIEREHAAFVVLGALATIAVFLQLSGVWL